MDESEQCFQLTDGDGRTREVRVNDVVEMRLGIVARTAGAMFAGGGDGVLIKTAGGKLIGIPRSADNDPKILDLMFACNNESVLKRFSPRS